MRTLFWLDWWQGEGPLCHRFPLLFNICDNQSISVASAITDCITLHRSLNVAGAAQWQELNLILTSTPLSHEQDEISWALDPRKVLCELYVRSPIAWGDLPHL